MNGWVPRGLGWVCVHHWVRACPVCDVLRAPCLPAYTPRLVHSGHMHTASVPIMSCLAWCACAPGTYTLCDLPRMRTWCRHALPVRSALRCLCTCSGIRPGRTHPACRAAAACACAMPACALWACYPWALHARFGAHVEVPVANEVHSNHVCAAREHDRPTWYCVDPGNPAPVCV